MDLSTQLGDGEQSLDQAAEALMNKWSGGELDEAEQPEANAGNEATSEEHEAPPEELEKKDETRTLEETEETQEVDTEDAEPQAETFKHVAELAEATEMELDEFLSSINVTTKVNGEEKEVSLADLKKGYQLESDYTRKNQAFIEEKKAFQESQEKAQNELKSELEKVGAAFGLAQQQLTHEFNAINWDELQRTNQTEYLIKRQQFGERQQQINLAIEQATSQANEVLEKQSAEQESKQQTYLQQENDLLLKAIPEWSDQEKREAGAKEVSDFLHQVGFSLDEVSQITDHRMIVLAREAIKGKGFDVDLAKKKVNEAPKLVRPNAKPQVNAQQQAVNKLRKKVKSSGDVDDVAKLLLARG